MRILLDHSVPRPLARLLVGHAVRTTADEGWSELSNGDLLAAAETAGFDCLLTGDRNLRHQQNLRTRPIAIIVLSTNAWPTLRANLQPILDALEAVVAGDCVEVALPRLPLRRRRFEPPA